MKGRVRAKHYWVMKSEPGVFSFDDLKASPRQTTTWEGVRNYQARNFMRDEMRVGDLVLFYHSNCPVPGVVGVAEVVAAARPDPSALDPSSPYFDPRSTPEHPVWFMVEVRWKEDFLRPVTLAAIRREPGLSNMLLVRKGQRLSVQPVTREDFRIILAMGRSRAP